MKKHIFVIPGFRHKISDIAYKRLKKTLERNDFVVHLVPIVWNYRVLTDQVAQFEGFYQKNRGEINHILGFSFGAMIAAIAASKLKPNKLFLCSLSPYFSEDIGDHPQTWLTSLGKKRIDDFSRIHFLQTAASITSPTTVFMGQLEAEKFPALEKRCRSASLNIREANLITIKSAPHDIGNPYYLAALRKYVS